MWIQIIWKSMIGKWKRNLISLLAIWVGMALITALAYLFFSVGDGVNREMASLGANIRLEPAESLFLGEVQSLPKSRLLSEKAIENLKKELFWRNNLLNISPRLWISLQWEDKKLQGLGLWINHAIPISPKEVFITGGNKIYQHWKIQGRWPAHERECMVGIEIAQKYHLKLGQSLTIQGSKGQRRFKIVGIHNSNAKENKAFVFFLSQAQRLSGLKGKVFSVDISAMTTPEKKLAIKYRRDPASLTPEEYERWACTPYPGTVAVQIQKSVPNSIAIVVRKVSETQGKVLGQLKSLVAALAFLGALFCSLSIMSIFILSLWERKVDIALMEAIGATWQDILILLILEGSILGVLGGFLGGMTGAYIGQWLLLLVFQKAYFTWGPLYLAPLLGFLLAIIGLLYPLYYLFSFQPAKILQEKAE